MKREVIVACDFESEQKCLDFLDSFGDICPYVKVGMELYYSAGPSIICRLKERGHKIFLDLKLHDIPNTVGRCAAVLGRLGVDMINVHAAGGSTMMKAAKKSIEECGADTKLIAVTQLTSTDQQMLENELLIPKKVSDVVCSYASNAKASGLDGVVCSPLEAGMIHDVCGNGFITVTPGVRFADGDRGDQKRVTTPAQARELGSDFIVVGRPITAAADPVGAYLRCCREFDGEN